MASNRGGNHYEEQFGDRIRAIGRGGSSAPAGPSQPSGLKAAGVIIGLIALVAVISSAVRPRTSSVDVSSQMKQLKVFPAPPPAFQVNPGDDEEMAQLRRALWNLNAGALPVDPQPPGEAKAQRSPLLTPEDVAYLPALCYLLHKEGHHTERTPARRVFDRLDADARKLLREIAVHANREPAPEKRDEILEALNKVLDDPDFYDPQYFRDVDLDHLQKRLADWTLPGKVRTQQDAREINRSLLEAAFPDQIIAGEDQPLEDEARRQAVAEAKDELTVLRAKYDDLEP
jgi:hypothetical protein